MEMRVDLFGAVHTSSPDIYPRKPEANVATEPRTAGWATTTRPGPARLTALRGALGAALTLGFALAVSPADSTAIPKPVKSTAPTGVAPDRLSETGLFLDVLTREVRPENRSYTPQYPLWSDGATKRRWIYLPADTRVDASDPNHWSFPIGTKLWKEFAVGNEIETRYMERRADGGWLFAAYVWAADGSDAFLAPAKGTNTPPALPAGTRWAIPGYYDCLACHEGRPERVLGFNALQLSPDRDPHAPHAVEPEPGSIDLSGLLADGHLEGAPASWAERPPRIPSRSPDERAALGYLFGNCANCHNSDGPLSDLELSFDVPVESEEPGDLPAVDTAFGVETINGPRESLRVAPGAPEESWLLARMASRDPLLQMPPLGTFEPDTSALALITRWIAHERSDDKPTEPDPARSN